MILKKIFLGIGITVLLIAIIIVFIVVKAGNDLNTNLESKGLTGIGKEFTVNVTQNTDYTIFEDGKEFEIWNKNERTKMIAYMKGKNIKLKAGTYTINQAYKFEKALEIFIFE